VDARAALHLAEGSLVSRTCPLLHGRRVRRFTAGRRAGRHTVQQEDCTMNVLNLAPTPAGAQTGQQFTAFGYLRGWPRKISGPSLNTART
jgi:hypothetical protein